MSEAQAKGAAGAEEEDDGISRCGISGLFDPKGNPAALASGWLQAVEKDKKRHRYYVLCPTYLAFFSSEEHAAISEEGFMLGDADYSSISSFGSTGANVALSNIYSCEPDPLGDSTFMITFKQATDDGTNAMQLACANKEIAKGWSDAIMGQAMNHGSILPPPRTKGPVGPTMEEMAREAASRAAVSAMKSMRSLAADTKKGGFGGLLGGLGGLIMSGGKKEEPERLDAEYVVTCPWDERGIDLQSKAGKTCLEDELGHPAAIMHGWLTKKNKTGIRVGVGEKERYFVLTPQALAFFPDEKVAAIKDGYMYGKAQGERIAGLFEKTGARLPLEAVCEVKLLARIDDSNQIRRKSSGRSADSNRNRSNTGDSDNEDEENDDDDNEDDSDDDEVTRRKKKAKRKAAAAKAAAEAAAAAAAAEAEKTKKKKQQKKSKDDSDDEEEEEEDEAEDDDSDDEEAKKKKKKAAKKAAEKAAEKKKAKKKAGSDDEEEEEDAQEKEEDEDDTPKKKKKGSSSGSSSSSKPKGEKPAKPAGPKPAAAAGGGGGSGAGGGKPSGGKPMSASALSAVSSVGGGSGSGGGSSSLPPAKPEGPPPSNLIEIDFGEYSLIVNAHNPKNRTTWVQALRKWSGWRKRSVDEDMFANFGAGGGGGGGGGY